MFSFARTFLLLALTLAPLIAHASDPSDALQSPLSSTPPREPRYPRIVLYSVSWCPHCKDAKEYLTRNNIPFINKDVELDNDAREELTVKYKSDGVPVIVIGNDDKVLKGFNKEKFEDAVKKVREKK